MQASYVVIAGLLMTGAMTGQPAVVPSRVTMSAEDELRRVDLRHSEMVQSGSAEAVRALLHPDYAVHLPNGRVMDLDQTMALVKSGALAHERHRRIQERVVISGTTAAVMGVDRLEAPPPLATKGERTRRYTNIYVREDGRWLLLARHFHFLL